MMRGRERGRERNEGRTIRDLYVHKAANMNEQYLQSQ